MSYPCPFSRILIAFCLFDFRSLKAFELDVQITGFMSPIEVTSSVFWSIRMMGDGSYHHLTKGD